MNEKLSVFDRDLGKPPGDWLRRFLEIENLNGNPREHGKALKLIFDDIRNFYREAYRNIALELAHDEKMRIILNEIYSLRTQINELKTKGETS